MHPLPDYELEFNVVQVLNVIYSGIEFSGLCRRWIDTTCGGN